MLWDQIYGNDKLKNTLQTFIKEGRLPHTMIIEGCKGSGKTLLSRIVSASMTETKNDRDKIMSGVSPDVVEVSLPDKTKTIGIAAVRDIREKAYLVPNDLDYKVFVINDAHCMTIQAQNALLKLIEEPPKNTYFMLLTESLNDLLPTVRSRAVPLRMQVFSLEALDSYLKENVRMAEKASREAPEKYRSVLMSASGSIGNAIKLLRSIGTDREDLILLILSALSDKNRYALLTYINKLPSDRDAFEKSVASLRAAIRDLLALMYNENAQTIYITNTDCLYDISEEKLYSADEMISSLQAIFSVNPNINGAKYHIYSHLIQ